MSQTPNTPNESQPANTTQANQEPPDPPTAQPLPQFDWSDAAGVLTTYKTAEPVTQREHETLMEVLRILRAPTIHGFETLQQVCLRRIQSRTEDDPEAD